VKAAPDKMLKLMAYADGELSGAEKKEVEEILAKDPEAKRFVAEIGTLGAFVKLGHQPKDIDVTDAVMAAVKEQPAEKSNVVSLADRRSRTKTAAVVIGVLALAAGTVFYSRPKETPLAKAPAPVAEPALPGVVVEPIESPGQSVKVIYGPGTNEMTTSVIIWVDEERK